MIPRSRSIYQSLSRLLYKWLFSDLLYKQMTLIFFKVVPREYHFFYNHTKRI